MTPKEKAEELVDKMYNVDAYDDYDTPTMMFKHAKKCALIAVDEIINCDSFFKTLDDTKYFTKYWKEVQNEIEKL